jgi:ferredoxin
MFSSMGQAFYKTTWGKAAKKFLVNAACTGCAICTLVCPVENIQFIEKRPRFENHCEECLACINLCPEKAIHFKKEPGTARFKNPHIALKELIAANHE